MRIARLMVVLLLAGSPLVAGQETQPAAAQPVFTFQEVMVPVRDGVHLQTVIMAPLNQTKPLPILFRRTPYGVPQKAPEQMPPPLKELAQDGYIFVIQNLRGRFKSEGYFELSSHVDLNDPKATNETTDAYDSIEWLVKNVPNNNGKVGMYGVSYDGLTTALTLLHPHPALKAISEQASPVDQWMNDDDHRYGALRESYDFEYAVLEQSDKNKNTYFTFETYDTFEWYLALGPLSNINEKYLHGKIPYWNDSVAHPDYDDFWKKEAWVSQLHASTVPNLNVAGFWDQEDPWGPWQIFHHAEEHDPEHTNFIVAGPWFHGQWQTPKGDSIGIVPFAGHETAREFRENIEAPFFRYYLHGVGDKPAWQASTFQSGSNNWHTYAAWPPKEAKATNLYFHSDGTLSFARTGKQKDRQTISRVRFRSGESCSLSLAANLSNLSGGGLAHLGSRRSALCRSSPGCSDLRQCGARPRPGYHWSAFRGPVCIHVRDRLRFCREGDRCVSAGCAATGLECRGGPQARPVCSIAEWV